MTKCQIILHRKKIFHHFFDQALKMAKILFNLSESNYYTPTIQCNQSYIVIMDEWFETFDFWLHFGYIGLYFGQGRWIQKLMADR